MRLYLSLFSITILFSLVGQRTDSVRLDAQQILIISDSIFIAKKDTFLLLPRGTKYQYANNKYIINQDFYNNIYSKAQKRKITKELYHLLVTERPPQEPQKTTIPVKSESFFEAYEGKKIRNIDFISVDILDGNVNDTSLISRSNLAKLSNRLHHNTRNHIINNYLLFKSGERVDPFVIADTERVVRSLSYIEDVRIRLVLNPSDLETTDVIVIYKDRFPWNITFNLDSDRALKLGFVNRNILGSGEEFGIGYLYSPMAKPNHGYDLHYKRRGIENTFIDGTVYTSNSYLGNRTGISFARNFVSPQIKYYGEATLEKTQIITDLAFADSLYETDFDISSNSFDLWVGRSFEVQQRSSLNLATRYQHENFIDRPQVRLDSNEIYHDHHLLLGALSFNKISYLKARNIISFNITEDIPEGYLISLLYGRDWNEFDPRTYRGLRAVASKYTSIGYVTLNLEAGFFKNNEIKRNEVIEFSARHFSPLFNIGRATSRLFTRFYSFNGTNLSIPQTETLNGQNRIRNLSGNQIRGDRLFSLSNEYVVYQPWYFYGFRFATYAHTGLGFVEETRSLSPYHKTYFNFGGGMRVRNESLVFDTFEIRGSYYPVPPPEGNNFTFHFTISAQSFFRSPSIQKPEIVGLD